MSSFTVVIFSPVSTSLVVKEKKLFLLEITICLYRYHDKRFQVDYLVFTRRKLGITNSFPRDIIFSLLQIIDLIMIKYMYILRLK